MCNTTRDASQMAPKSPAANSKDLALDERARTTLERSALECPVHASLAREVDLPVRFEWIEASDVPPRG